MRSRWTFEQTEMPKRLLAAHYVARPLLFLAKRRAGINGVRRHTKATANPGRLCGRALRMLHSSTASIAPETLGFALYALLV